VLEHRDPGRVELGRPGGSPATGDPVGLLDERDAEPVREGRVPCSHEVRRIDAAGRAVAEDDRGTWTHDEVEVGARRPVRRIDFDGLHAADTYTRRVARLAAATAILIVCLAAAGAGHSSTSPGGTIIFSVFSGLPVFEGNESCEGLYAIEPDGSGLRRLVSPGLGANGGQLYPSIASDGGMLSFLGLGNSTGTVASLYGLDGANGAVRRLAGIRAYPLFFRFPWSPRGRSLLVPHQQGKSVLEIQRLDAGTGRLRRLTHGAADIWPAWSPDGSTIAFARQAPAGSDSSAVWLMAADGTRERRVAVKASDPAWSPDGRRVAFFRPSLFSSPLGPSSVWVIGRGGGKARRVARGLLNRGFGSLLWSPRGDELLVLRKPTTAQFPGEEHEPGDAYRLDVATGRSRLVARRVIPLGWYGDGIVYLHGRYVQDETVFEIRLLRPGASGSRLLGVIDEEDVNIGSYPARQLHHVPLAAAKGRFAPPPAAGDECLHRLAALVRSLR